MISLLLAAGAAAEPSAKFLALEQDWATDKVGLFFQHKDFETAWSNIQRDIEPQLKAAAASTLDFIFMGTGMTPIAELLVMARTYDLAKSTRPETSWRVRVLFFDKIYRDADARVITRIGELLGGTRLDTALGGTARRPVVQRLTTRGTPAELAEYLEETAQDGDAVTIAAGFNALNMWTDADLEV